ncbi:hypothetical protein [Aquirufa aurantiipilula]|uniref:Response regulator receiver protein n=1 Tax=Aquirufa aurantiipilula TaxID=2696561 RepID=A0ABT6BK07_9BACT|nr:hypothetical protein [Aquirufa aurantiipilula]MBZ1326626.1 hypothetical protein [Aquirufa aurantiipilula]MDF5690801.1 hypothetical protein [Aquirufa aurantiipilula]
MKIQNVLVVGKNEAIVELLIKLVNKYPELFALGTCKLEDISSICQISPVDILLISSGLSLNQENEVKQLVKQFHPNLKTVEHFGGGSGLLKTELNQVLDRELGGI